MSPECFCHLVQPAWYTRPVPFAGQWRKIRGQGGNWAKKRDARARVEFTDGSQGFFARRLRSGRKSHGFIESKAILLDTSSFALGT